MTKLEKQDRLTKALHSADELAECRGWSLSTIREKSKLENEKHLFITLCKISADLYVTHLYNYNTNEFMQVHYFDNKAEASDDLQNRNR